MNFRPRDYQRKAHDSVFAEWKSVTSTLVVCPTGGGKTCIFAMVIESIQPKRAMVLAHREELIFQARDKIHKVTGLECGIEMGELYVNSSLFGETPVIISTVQTQNSKWGDRHRMGRFNPKEFGVLIIDEFHHATADSYRRVIDYYKHNNPDIKVLGVTATPDRADEEALGQVVDTVAFDYELIDAIRDGWLVPIEQQFVSIGGLDWSEVKTTLGDLNQAELAKVMESESNSQGIIAASIQIIGDKRAILFTCSVKQAEQSAEILNRHRTGMADWVCGFTPKDERREKLDRFKKGDIQVMCNCGVLTEGFDDPGVQVIIMGRPTKSRSLYAQMAGRGTRPVDGLVDQFESADDRVQAILHSAKPSCLIVDFVGNSGRHKLMSAADILGGKVSDEAIAKAVEKAKKSGTAVRVDAALSEEEEALRRKIEDAKKRAEDQRKKLVAKVQFKKQSINPFDVFDIQPVKARGWDAGKALSEKQSNLLMRQGINPDKIPYSQARQLVGELCRRFSQKLCTLKQAQRLQRFGYNTKDMTKEQASKLMEQLVARRWAQPSPNYVDKVNARIAELKGNKHE